MTTERQIAANRRNAQNSTENASPSDRLPLSGAERGLGGEVNPGDTNPISPSTPPYSTGEYTDWRPRHTAQHARRVSASASRIRCPLVSGRPNTV